MFGPRLKLNSSVLCARLTSRLGLSAQVVGILVDQGLRGLLGLVGAVWLGINVLGAVDGTLEVLELLGAGLLGGLLERLCPHLPHCLVFRDELGLVVLGPHVNRHLLAGLNPI